MRPDRVYRNRCIVQGSSRSYRFGGSGASVLGDFFGGARRVSTCEAGFRIVSLNDGTGVFTTPPQSGHLPVRPANSAGAVNRRVALDSPSLVAICKSAQAEANSDSQLSGPGIAPRPQHSAGNETGVLGAVSKSLSRLDGRHAAVAPSHEPDGAKRSWPRSRVAVPANQVKPEGSRLARGRCGMLP